jgi:hypothetical protein
VEEPPAPARLALAAPGADTGGQLVRVVTDVHDRPVGRLINLGGTVTAPLTSGWTAPALEPAVEPAAASTGPDLDHGQPDLAADLLAAVQRSQDEPAPDGGLAPTRPGLLRVRFPDEHADVYTLAEALLEGRTFTHGEAAAALGVSPSTGGRRLRQARDLVERLDARSGAGGGHADAAPRLTLVNPAGSALRADRPATAGPKGPATRRAPRLHGRGHR